MAEDVLLVDKSEGIATLTLNRPRAMNALSAALRAELARAFVEVSADPDVGAVILTGAGDRAFSAGLDLKELGGETEVEPDVRAAVGGAGTDPVRAMEACDRPIIGAINGVAITGGFEIALACDVLVGSTNARFADTHARVGIMPGWGLSQRLSRAIGIYRAKELSLTGNFLSAERAERWGLLNRVVAPDELMDVCRGLARDMLSCQPGLVPAYKDVIDRGFAATFAEGRRIETEANRKLSSDVSPEAIAAARRAVTARGRAQAG
jgi:enoyl-CoA hydratase